MTCGRAPVGGCDDPDLGHLGPCTFVGETPEHAARRRARRAEKRARYEANRARRQAANREKRSR